MIVSHGGILLSIAVIAIVIGLFLKGIDRKLAAYMQSRIGPPLLQPFYDIGKLTQKQTIIPSTAVVWLFVTGPVIALAANIVLLLYMSSPYISKLLDSSAFTHANIIVVIYLLLIPSIALVISAFATASPYASIGAQREMVIMMGTKLPIVTIILSHAWHTMQFTNDPFSISSIVNYSIWHDSGAFGILGGILLLCAMLLILPAEMSRVPFDQAEAETEIAGGIIVEYSGKLLAFVLLAESVKAVSLSMLVILLFFPHSFKEIVYSFISLNKIEIPLVGEIVFLLIKIIVVYCMSVTFLRVVMARFKISYAARLFLYAVSSITLVGMMLVMLDSKLMHVVK